MQSDFQLMNEQNNKKKIAKGIIVLAGFVGLLWYSAVYFNPSQQPLSARLKTLGQKIQQVFERPALKTIFHQSVVEEESLVIKVVEKVSPAVVSVVIKTTGFDLFSGPFETEEGIGTGFIVDPSGIIVTNSHVVDTVEGEYSVILNDGTTYDVTKVNLDSPSDIAIVEINARGLPTVELGDSSSLKVGQKAVAIGNALGRFSNTVTVGVISGISRELTASGPFGQGAKTYEGAIQTDAALNPGNSGGPLLNSSGQVIGINVATTQGADNIGFAIPINTLKPILEMYLKEGKIVRPYLGVVYTMISPDLAKLRDFPEGAFISQVLPRTPAGKAGLKRADIITKIGDKALNSKYSLSEAIADHKVGDFVELTIDREGKDMKFSVTLEEAPGNP